MFGEGAVTALAADTGGGNTKMALKKRQIFFVFYQRFLWWL